MNPSLKRGLFRTFTQMLDDLKGVKEKEAFLKDFFEEAELESYIRRISTVYWIKKGRDKDNIKRNLGTSEKEIALSRKLLNKEGVKLGLKKIEAEEFANVWSDRIKDIVRK